MPELNHIGLLDDEPTLHDALNRQDIVEELAYRILTCPTPLVLGIHGDWGAGKTSFLKQLRNLLDHTEERLNVDPQVPKLFNPVTVWFDAWRYQNEAAPVVALLSAIREEFGRIAKTANWLKKIGDVTIRSLLAMLSDIGKFIQFEVMPDAAKVQAFGEQWEKDHLANKLNTDTALEFLQEAINILLRGSSNKNNQSPTRRVVVFIDDLDRCEPEAAYKLLEGLKIYLHLENCVFILGMNQRAVEDAIASRLPKSLENQDHITRIRAAAYLEKICQNVWRLPLPEDPAKILQGWIGSQIANHNNPPVDLNQLNQLFATAFIDKNGTPIKCLPPNPRRLKGLANFLLRHLDLLPATTDPNLQKRDFRNLLLVAYVFQFHHDLFVRWQYEPKLYNLLLRWLRSELSDETKPIFLKALQLPESLIRDASTPTPSYNVQPNYPDPGEANLFWIAPLLLDMAEQHVAADFIPYLKCQS
ncbi:P-loop NTPase fold protein [Methylomonas koyamae]|uniref:KAP family P-loop NTPase fold protein n=1 Tax=Methylomonas koyamae TaxID=702114 RepID=UPI00112ACB71|nr:P-loop NTPase fold protein [Methylomonas koyamae]TPQ26418.1 hypothetical protein C2U68_11090 [Methylomonas koyamae]